MWYGGILAARHIPCTICFECRADGRRLFYSFDNVRSKPQPKSRAVSAASDGPFKVNSRCHILLVNNGQYIRPTPQPSHPRGSVGGREENWNRQRGHHIPIDRGDYFAWHNYVDKRSVQVQVFVIMDKRSTTFSITSDRQMKRST